MLTRFDAENLSWEDVVNMYFENEEDERTIINNFPDTLWFYNTGEFDMSEYKFAEEKEDFINSFE